MARRGVLGSILHEMKVEQQKREREERKAVREHDAAVRKYERALAAEERAQEKLRRAEEAKAKKAFREAEAQRKALEKEAREAHLIAMQAEVEEKNSALEEIYEDIDGLLEATLDKDDYVDLDSLKLSKDNFPFPQKDLEVPNKEPVQESPLDRPEYVEPKKPNRFLGIFPRKKLHLKQIAEAKEVHSKQLADWEAETAEIEKRNADLLAEYESLENDRKAQLDKAIKEHDKKIADHNEKVDKLSTDLGYGVAEAIEEYVSIVLSNSVYPDNFPVDYEHDFESETAELLIKVFIPSPDKIPEIKKFIYKKNTDEITESYLSNKAAKDRYESAVHQVALRTIHEVFEADRRGLIKSTSMQVGTTAIDPATGKVGYKPFVAVAAERDAFLELVLEKVVPKQTLKHLGASLSKDPRSLVEADTSGIRKV